MTKNNMRQKFKITKPYILLYSLIESDVFFKEFLENPETLKTKEIPRLTYFSIPEQLERENKKKAR